MSSSIRQRRRSNSRSPAIRKIAELADIEDNSFSVLDIFRTLILIAIIVGLFSYFVTGESFIWDVPNHVWKRPVALMKTWLEGPKKFTDDDLRAFDGTDTTKPILIAINGTVYDVSANPRMYGPGGSYHFFAGRDASRAFVSNCFDEDLTPDMRGLEEMYLPLDDQEIDSLYSSGELKVMKQKERREALKLVDKNLRIWTEFFAHNKKYTKVGEIVREEGWDKRGNPHPLCKRSAAMRKKRNKPRKEVN